MTAMHRLPEADDDQHSQWERKEIDDSSHNWSPPSSMFHSEVGDAGFWKDLIEDSTSEPSDYGNDANTAGQRVKDSRSALEKQLCPSFQYLEKRYKEIIALDWLRYGGSKGPGFCASKREALNKAPDKFRVPNICHKTERLKNHQ